VDNKTTSIHEHCDILDILLKKQELEIKTQKLIISEQNTRIKQLENLVGILDSTQNR